MKKKSVKSLIAYSLAFSMAFVQPATVLAEETAEAVSENETESEMAEPENSTETQELSSEEQESSSENKEENKEETVTENQTDEQVTSTETEENATEEVTTEEESEEQDVKSLGTEKELTLEELGFRTMSLNNEMLLEKKELSKVAATMSSMTPGEDYVENELVYMADTEEIAKTIADCYGGELTEYEYGVAVAHIEESVEDAVKIAADNDVMIPAVYPNIIYNICDDDSYYVLEDETQEESEQIETVSVGNTDEQQMDFVFTDEHLYASAPNDRYFAKQWYHENLNTVEAWNASKGEGVTVAVIDTGVDYNHPDLKNNIVGHISTIGGDGKDDHGHGTHCAGIIAATAGNSIGVSGVAPNAKIYGIKVLNSEGSGATAYIIQGVKAAISQNVDVISMSLGGVYWDAAFQKAINDAVNNGIVVVAAAGNEATIQKSYPAAYDNVIAVAATDSNDKLTDFSNYGEWVDIAAPGYNILSTLPTGFTVEGCKYESQGYGYMSGTSMACPVVAGTVALMLGNSDELRNNNTKAGVSKITSALINSANPNGARSYYYGYYYSNVSWSTDPNYYYPLADAEAAVYAVDSSEVKEPVIKFSNTPSNKNVVLSGDNEYMEFSTTTPHSKIYVTKDGTKPSAQNGELYTGKIYIPLSGKYKIQAVTVVGNKVSKVFSQTYTFEAKAKSLDCSDTCYKNMKVAIGSSIELGVQFMPLYTSNQKLEWTSNDSTNKITVKNGKVSCKKDVTPGTKAVITAKTTDGTDLKYEFNVTATNDKIEGITLNKTDINMSYYAEKGDDWRDNWSSLTMKDTDGANYVKGFQLKPSNSGITTNQYLYKSSNTKVAVVSADGYITAMGKGKAKITVTANDGSGKTAVCNVNVVTPVFYVYGYTSTGFSSGSSYIPIGTGCSIKINTYINYNSSYYLYVPNNKKLIWTSNNAGVTVSNGKVTCKSNTPVGTNVKITATAADGFGASCVFNFTVTDKITKITYGKKNSLTLKGNVGNGMYDPYTNGYVTITTANGTRNYCRYTSVDISNHDVVYRYASSYGYVIICTKPGSSKVTYTALDGSNTKFTINFKIAK